MDPADVPIQALVRPWQLGSVRQALARALVDFADDIGAPLIAEGIETQAERDTLLALGVRLGQGFLMARPGTVSELNFAATLA